MDAIFALAMKDLRLLLRDRANAFFTFVFPLLLAMFFGAVFGGGGGGSGRMDVVAVDLDGGPAARAFLADLAAADGLNVTTTTTRADGERQVRRGAVQALVVVPKGFDESAGNMFSGTPMRIEAVVDPGRSAEAGLLTGKLNEIAFMQMGRLFNDPAKMTAQLDRARASINNSPDVSAPQKLLFGTFFTALDRLVASQRAGGAGEPAKAEGSGFAWRPVDVQVSKLEADPNRPNNSYAISFPQGIVWGLMGCVTAFGLSLAFERTHGTLMRLTTSPLSRSTILLGKALACFVACVIVQVMLLAVAVALFNVRIASPVAMVFAVAISSFGFVGVMMLLAGMSRSEGAAAGMGRALILVLAMIGGGTIPVFFMPDWLKTASSVSPFKWATVVVEGSLWRGMTVFELATPFAVLIGMGIVGYAIGAIAFRAADAR
ncbi:MAG: ABC transporter permease [Phycisphaeraceae bacterium]|nr:ABC transporter permease [Phycisphaeraceae bacterium]